MSAAAVDAPIPIYRIWAIANVVNRVTGLQACHTAIAEALICELHSVGLTIVPLEDTP